MNTNDTKGDFRTLERSDSSRRQRTVKRAATALLGTILTCGFALEASAKIHSDNVQSANATLSDCVVLNTGSAAETVYGITIYYYDELLHPHVLAQTTAHQLVQPGDAVFVQDGYAVPRSQGYLVPSTSCTVVTSDDSGFRAVFELRDKNGDTIINEALR